MDLKRLIKFGVFGVNGVTGVLMFLAGILSKEHLFYDIFPMKVLFIVLGLALVASPFVVLFLDKKQTRNEEFNFFGITRMIVFALAGYMLIATIYHFLGNGTLGYLLWQYFVYLAVTIICLVLCFVPLIKPDQKMNQLRLIINAVTCLLLEGFFAPILKFTDTFATLASVAVIIMPLGLTAYWAYTALFENE
ncbi:MAG: hypothetical protein K6C32_05180 [Bacilli bacterium]|nr:hypothetical protein [Bacilli bacterium]